MSPAWPQPQKPSQGHYCALVHETTTLPPCVGHSLAAREEAEAQAQAGPWLCQRARGLYWCLPFIHSDGNKSSKATPLKKPGKQDCLLPPPSLRILLTPPIHEVGVRGSVGPGPCRGSPFLSRPSHPQSELHRARGEWVGVSTGRRLACDSVLRLLRDQHWQIQHRAMFSQVLKAESQGKCLVGHAPSPALEEAPSCLSAPVAAPAQLLSSPCSSLISVLSLLVRTQVPGLQPTLNPG